jgi:hypothetical protein
VSVEKKMVKKPLVFYEDGCPSGWLILQQASLPQRDKFAPVLGFALLFEKPCPVRLRGHSSPANRMASWIRRKKEIK